MSLLGSRRKQTTSGKIFSPSLYEFKRRFLLKIMCCHDDIWLHLSLTFLKPWANQCVFLMAMFFLGYVNEPYVIYLRLHLQVGSPKTQNQLDKPVCFTHANVLLSYVNETVFAWQLAFLQDSCQSDYGPGQLILCQCYLKIHVVGEGPGASLWVLRHFLSLISRLLVAI